MGVGLSHPISVLRLASPDPMFTPLAPHVHPTCTQRSPHLHPMFTPLAPHVHSTCTPCSPHLHPMFTHLHPTFTPLAPHVHPTCTQRSPQHSCVCVFFFSSLLLPCSFLVYTYTTFVFPHTYSPCTATRPSGGRSPWGGPHRLFNVCCRGHGPQR